MTTPIRQTTALAALAVLAACATPTDPYVEGIQTQYDALASDAAIAGRADTALQEARQAVDDLRAAFEAGASETTLRSYGYVAERRFAVVRERALETRQQEALEALRQEREQILVDARTRETAEARARAARAEAGQAAAEARAQAAEQLAEEAQRQLEAALAELDAERDARGLVVTLEDVVFETDSAELTSGGRDRIRRVAEAVAKLEGRKVIVEGHTDSTGEADYNQALSERRANAVRDALIASGLGGDGVTAVGLGEDRPIAPNDTEAGRQQNRRVEIIVQDA